MCLRVSVSDFQINKFLKKYFNDFNVASFLDDKSEVQIGNIVLQPMGENDGELISYSLHTL